MYEKLINCSGKRHERLIYFRRCDKIRYDMTNEKIYDLGIDIGSTTAKVVLTDGESVLYERYERHNSAVREKTVAMLGDLLKEKGDITVKAALSGSAALGLASEAGVAFVQEVYAEGEVVKYKEKGVNCVIELGGEDAKMIFIDKNGGLDERMNGTCAGGTGAFIDQMATLLNVSADELDKLSLKAEKAYPIASRCGVFAKSDIQPLLNQGARKEDVAASIYKAVVTQTIAGLARGKKIDGKVLFLGGPLFYLKGLQKAFKETLKLSDENAVFPEYARYAVALGAAYYAGKAAEQTKLSDLLATIEKCGDGVVGDVTAPLFKTREEYDEFIKRQSAYSVKRGDIRTYKGKVYVGIDCGSTTTKLCAVGEDKQLLYTYYGANKGEPLAVVKEKLLELYALLSSEAEICGSAVTGYGEELVKNAFSVDEGVVETIAHYTAAKYFCPEVEFILDVGGQDIKCFKIRNGAIDAVMLNEACSSGCGSFLETFAKALGYTAEEFAKIGLFAARPVNLGSRCTVFMNSSVKQAQKDGATVEDISAGLALSVVKNALYKVIRVNSADELGKKIVVQGGTFYNDAVLRAFEREVGAEVIRPDVAGLMGAYGAALKVIGKTKSTLAGVEELENFSVETKATTCGGCTNRCRLTVNKFSDGKTFISGNNCDRPTGKTSLYVDYPDVYESKRAYLKRLAEDRKNCGYKMGLPLGLGTYELAPLWHGIFSALGFDVVFSPVSSKRIYELGQFTIPSDTACYPAKLMHGHVIKLIDDGVDGVFYPCLPYNIDEDADNHYNCPVVAYYSELLKGNVDALEKVDFWYPYLNINDKKQLKIELKEIFGKKFDFTSSQISKAVEKGFKQLDAYRKFVKEEGVKALKFAREHGKRILVLAGRPYHIDEEICHGIDRLARSLGFVVVSEDSVCDLAKNKNTEIDVLNQWTYHSRLYKAAYFVAENKDVELCQLVSFGCGVDAITTDEVRRILENADKIYTQLKIDEITNLGSVKIRLRSLLGAIEERENKQ